MPALPRIAEALLQPSPRRGQPAGRCDADVQSRGGRLQRYHALRRQCLHHAGRTAPCKALAAPGDGIYNDAHPASRLYTLLHGPAIGRGGALSRHGCYPACAVDWVICQADLARMMVMAYVRAGHNAGARNAAARPASAMPPIAPRRQRAGGILVLRGDRADAAVRSARCLTIAN